MTTFEQRTILFSQAATAACPGNPAEMKIQKALSASNRGSMLEGRTVYLGYCNLEKFLGQTTRDLRFQTCFRFIPDDEVHFQIRIADQMALFRQRLETLAREATASGATKINNNVRFYLGTDGLMYLANDFFDALPDPATIAPGIPVDRLDYAIFAPVADVRGLASTEFVNFLAKTVGPEISFAHSPWGATMTAAAGEAAGVATPAGSVAATVRKPRDFTLAEIQAGITARGGHYDDDIVGRFHAAMTYLEEKHFAILAGVSGSGKTSLVTRYAHTIHAVAKGGSDPLLFFVPVQPDWTDRTGLVGYADAITGRYVVPRFLEALLAATANPDASVIVCLDEMNLARVEHYLSDVLSCIENRDAVHLHSQAKAMDGDNGMQVPPSIQVPSNLHLVGTINVDETTHRIADKVLDRAVFIDTSKVDIPGYLDRLGSEAPALAPSITHCRAILTALATILAEHGVPFGYRTAREALHYHLRAVGLGGDPTAVLDEILVQKMLTKLKGGQSLQPLLDKLAKAVATLPRSTALVARLMTDLNDYGSFQAVR